MDMQSNIRILVVEDEILIALALQDILTDLGFDVVGPAHRREDALILAEEATISGALLDINLHGKMVYPVVDLLTRRGVPIALCTGYASAGVIPARYAGLPRIDKPFDTDALKATILPLFARPLRPPADVY